MISQAKKIVKVLLTFGVLQFWLVKEFFIEIVLVFKNSNIKKRLNINEHDLKKLVMHLSFWERKILLMHYKKGLPLDNIATELSFDKNEVKKIYENTLFKLNLVDL